MTDKIVEFPLTRIENFDSLTEREIVYQLRLQAIALLNRLNTNTTRLPPGTDLEALRTINAASIEFGFGPLDFEEKPINVKKIGYLSEE